MISSPFKPILIVATLLLTLCACAQKVSGGYASSDPFADGKSFTVNLEHLGNLDWCYPLPGAKVISPYGNGRGTHRHSGVDLKTKARDSIRAAFNGIVTECGVNSGYGKCIVIRHPFGFSTLYSHNYKNLVSQGEYVNAGQVIALAGRTGRATTEHLHFEVRVKGRHYNPDILFNHKTHSLKRHRIIFYSNGKMTVK